MNSLPPACEVYTLADLRDWPALTPPLRLAVLGDPVAHSASPPMQNAALAAEGIDARYTRLHIRPNELATALRLLAPAGFCGVNLTIPHKAAALPLLDLIDPHADSLGAVNTVRVEPDGRLRGFNTDGPGCARAVFEAFGTELGAMRVLVLGAGGGAGRALAIQCYLDGCPRVLLANRTSAKALALRDQLADPSRVAVVDWNPAALIEAAAEVDLAINATAVGLELGNLIPLPAAALSSRLLVFDAVYRSGGVTPLVETALRSGAKAVGGLPLLLHQGALAFEHWFSRPAPLEAMRQALLQPAC